MLVDKVVEIGWVQGEETRLLAVESSVASDSSKLGANKLSKARPTLGIFASYTRFVPSGREGGSSGLRREVPGF